MNLPTCVTGDGGAHNCDRCSTERATFHARACGMTTSATARSVAAQVIGTALTRNTPPPALRAGWPVNARLQMPPRAVPAQHVRGAPRFRDPRESFPQGIGKSLSSQVHGDDPFRETVAPEVPWILIQGASVEGKEMSCYSSLMGTVVFLQVTEHSVHSETSSSNRGSST